MATVKRCDRCGWCYEKMESGSGLITLNVYAEGIADNLDLCKECTNKLLDWLKEPKKEEEEYHD